uniref:Uncharacterized protein n=1 Tax=Solanum lycopersicum TaxID=4081 RepID=A0A3Q7IDI3_SOLLC
MNKLGSRKTESPTTCHCSVNIFFFFVPQPIASLQVKKISSLFIKNSQNTRDKPNFPSIIQGHIMPKLKKYRDKEMDLVQMKQRGKRKIKGELITYPRTSKALYSLRFEILQKVNPYVTYGHPNLKSVKYLIYKKSLEVVPREIDSVGPHFKKFTRFLFRKREDHINELISKMNYSFSYF